MMRARLCDWLAALRIPSTAPEREPDAANYLALAGAVETVLLRDVLEKWFPAAIDPAGGFYQVFRRDWTRSGADVSRDVVYQARLTWTAAAAARRYPAHPAKFADANRHGMNWLADRQWDRRHGGFLWSVDTLGAPTGEWAEEKHGYGIAFGIYAASASFLLSGDREALALALAAFAWLETHLPDVAHGGYRESAARDGSPLAAPDGSHDAIGTRRGRRTANTHLHVLEALATLHGACRDGQVRARLTAISEIVSNRLTSRSGRLNLTLSEDWRPLPGPESYGHAFEAAFLLHEAALSLHGHADAATLATGRALVDRALARGVDRSGGINHEGSPDDRRKTWWAQAEALNALLLMHEAFGGETPRYWTAFVRLWEFILAKQLDRRHGGWHAELDARDRPRGRVKSDGWTDCYHQARALFTVGDRLRSLAGQGDDGAVAGSAIRGNAASHPPPSLFGEPAALPAP